MRTLSVEQASLQLFKGSKDHCRECQKTAEKDRVLKICNICNKVKKKKTNKFN